MKLWLSPQEAYQLLAGGPGGLPTANGRRFPQLRSKRFSPRSSSGGALAAGPGGWLKRAGAAPGGSGGLYTALLLLPLALVLLAGLCLWRVKLHSLPPVIQDVPGGKQCFGWRQTYFCHPLA